VLLRPDQADDGGGGGGKTMGASMFLKMVTLTRDHGTVRSVLEKVQIFKRCKSSSKKLPQHKGYRGRGVFAKKTKGEGEKTLVSKSVLKPTEKRLQKPWIVGFHSEAFGKLMEREK